MAIIGLAFTPSTLSQTVKGEPEVKGNMWFSFGPGVVTAAQYIEIHTTKIVNGNDAGILVRKYSISTSNGMMEARKWMAAKIVPILSARPKVESLEALLKPIQIFVYCSPEARKENILMVIPLDDVFDNFSDQDFNALLTKWEAKLDTENFNRAILKK